jgi:hypothetical protein
VGAVTGTINGADWISDTSSVGGHHLDHTSTNNETWETDSGVLTTPLTVCGWTRFDDMTSFDNGFVGLNTGQDGLDTVTDGEILSVINGGTRIQNHPFASVGNWGFWSYSVDSSEHRLITFDNSQELADTTNSTGTSVSGNVMSIGRRSGVSSYLNGQTDFVVVSEGSKLTKTQITELWEATKR